MQWGSLKCNCENKKRIEAAKVRFAPVPAHKISPDCTENHLLGVVRLVSLAHDGLLKRSVLSLCVQQWVHVLAQLQPLCCTLGVPGCGVGLTGAAACHFGTGHLGWAHELEADPELICCSQAGS